MKESVQDTDKYASDNTQSRDIDSLTSSCAQTYRKSETLNLSVYVWVNYVCFFFILKSLDSTRDQSLLSQGVLFAFSVFPAQSKQNSHFNVNHMEKDI